MARIAGYLVDRDTLDKAIELLLDQRFLPFYVDQTTDSDTWLLRVVVKDEVYTVTEMLSEALHIHENYVSRVISGWGSAGSA